MEERQAAPRRQFFTTCGDGDATPRDAIVNAVNQDTCLYKMLNEDALSDDLDKIRRYLSAKLGPYYAAEMDKWLDDLVSQLATYFAVVGASLALTQKLDGDNAAWLQRAIAAAGLQDFAPPEAPTTLYPPADAAADGELPGNVTRLGVPVWGRSGIVE